MNSIFNQVYIQLGAIALLLLFLLYAVKYLINRDKMFIDYLQNSNEKLVKVISEYNKVTAHNNILIQTLLNMTKSGDIHFHKRKE